MSFWADKASTARDLIARFGQPITVVRETGASIDPVTGAATQGAEEQFTPMGVIRPYPARFVDGTLIQRGDREMIVDDTVEPKVSDTVLIGGEPWSVVNVETVNPAGVPIIYRVQVRA